MSRSLKRLWPWPRRTTTAPARPRPRPALGVHPLEAREVPAGVSFMCHWFDSPTRPAVHWAVRPTLQAHPPEDVTKGSPAGQLSQPGDLWFADPMSKEFRLYPTDAPGRVIVMHPILKVSPGQMAGPGDPRPENGSTPNAPAGQDAPMFGAAPMAGAASSAVAAASPWAVRDTGLTDAGKPAVVYRTVTRPDGTQFDKVNVFVRSGTHLWERYFDGTTWTQYDTGIVTNGDPAVHQRGTGDNVRVNVFVVGADGHLYERLWDGARWSNNDVGLPPSGQALVGTPVILARGDLASVNNATLRLNVFVRDAAGTLWERNWNGASWAWQSTTMPAGLTLARDPVLAVRGNAASTANADVRINLFAQGGDGNLWERHWNGSTWAWSNTGRQVAGDPTVVMYGAAGTTSNANVRIHLFVRGANGNLQEREWNGSSWTWFDRGQAISGKPTAVLWGNPASTNMADVRINVFARTAGGVLFERAWNGSGWNTLTTTTVATDSPTAVVSGNLSTSTGVRINVFFPGANGDMWEREWNGSGWSTADTGMSGVVTPVVLARPNVSTPADPNDVSMNVWARGANGNLWERESR